MSIYKPGFYEKNGVRREALSPSAAVALVFEGFKPVRDESEAPAPSTAPPAPLTSTAATPATIFGDDADDDEE